MQKKIIFGISLSAIFAILITISILFFSTQIITMIFCKVMFSKYPVVYKVPEKITLGNYFFTNTTKFSCFGDDFEFPWSDIAKQSVSQNFSMISFKSGILVTILSPEFSTDFAQTFKNKDPKKAKLYYSFLGEKALQDDYNFYKVILNTTPKDISLFKSPKKDVGITIKLVLKNLLAINGNSGIYEFDNGKFHTFQFGNPSMAKFIVFSIFNEKNKRLDFFLFDKKHKNKVNISQKEINFIVSSIKHSCLSE